METLDEEKTEGSKACVSPTGFWLCCGFLVLLLAISCAILMRRRKPGKNEVELALDEVRELKRRTEARAEEEYSKARALVASAHSLEQRLKKRAGEGGEADEPEQPGAPVSSPGFAPTNELFTAFGKRFGMG